MKNCVYVIEGNIASGKSTILDNMAKLYPNKIECLQEQVKDWNDTNLLQLFYEQQQRWSYTFESFVQLSRLKNHYSSVKPKTDEKLVLMERSLWSSYNVFAKNSYEEQRISQLEYNLLSYNFKLFTSIMLNRKENHQELPFNVIYLKTDPVVCYERVKKRNRNGETMISLDYLTKIHIKYEEWIKSLLKEYPKCVQTLDSNLKLNDVLNQIISLNI